MTTKSYPLHWPDHWPRTSAGSRKRANFNTRRDTGASYRMKRSLTVAEGVERILSVLNKMGIPEWQVIISTNIPVKGDGTPYSGRREPDDPGAAVYWRPYGSPPNTPYKVLPIDQYDRVADNLASIAGTLDALRTIERWGGGRILERTTAGLDALPSSVGDANASAWWIVLGVDHNASRDDVEAAYRRARREAHPDHGGSPESFNRVQNAWKQYLEASDEQ